MPSSLHRLPSKKRKNQLFKKNRIKRRARKKHCTQYPPVPVVPPVLPVPPVPGVPLKRVMKERWPVNIYHGQYESLKDLAAEERKQGGLGSMSQMVREAIDKLIAERRAK